ncbi:probable galacturonosyltransferase 7 isoform X2 [Tanacetum coccineum]
MSDNIPYEIQMEIIKKVSNVKSLIQFRSVSKPWKSFIDSSQFINGYGSRHTQPHSHILTYYTSYSSDTKFICLVDDDIETFKVQQKKLTPFVVSPLLKQYFVSRVVGACHGLLCLYGFHKGYRKGMVVIWNPSIGKSFGIAAPYYSGTDYGFGVCPVTKDPTLVDIKHRINMPWYVEVFTLSSRVWNVIPSSNLPRQSVRLNPKTQVVIGRFIYWGAFDMTSADAKYIVVSFDLITKEFKVVDLPDSLRNVCVAKLRESLVVYGSVYVDGAECCGVWVMEHDSSFRKLFTIGARVSEILGFSKSGETIFEIRKEGVSLATLDVYDPCSHEIKNLEISGVDSSFFMGSYKESLLLLDHLDSRGTEIRDDGMAILGRGNAPISCLALRGCKWAIRNCLLVTNKAMKALAKRGRLQHEFRLLRNLDICNRQGIYLKSVKYLKKPYFHALQWTGIGQTSLILIANTVLPQICRERPWLTICKDGCEVGCRDGWCVHWGTEIRDDGMAILGRGNAPISYLSLRGCKWVTDKGIKFLLGSKGLIELCIKNCLLVMNKAMKALAKRGRLQHELRLLRKT